MGKGTAMAIVYRARFGEYGGLAWVGNEIQTVSDKRDHIVAADSKPCAAVEIAVDLLEIRGFPAEFADVSSSRSLSRLPQELVTR